ncbi:MAG: cytochrome c3 family protein [Betaproteobacteria bacterium]
MMLKQFSVILCTALALMSTAMAQPKANGTQPVNCLDCHSDLAPEKGAHPAVAMGCTTCHTGIDASDVPHKITNKIAKGLSAEQPDLCYDCHDKSMFDKKVVHAAVGMGCTGCHNPHASKNPKLLVTDIPALCYTCHDKGTFTKKTVHPPVESGMCTTCHSPHASNDIALLLQPVNKLCSTCHEKQSSGRHIMSGFGFGDDHPVKGKADPSKPNRELSCVSCHNPHASSGKKLFVNEMAGPANLCLLCHKKISVKIEGP